MHDSKSDQKINNPRLEIFQAITLPAECPPDWPFENWVGPDVWEKLHTRLFWYSFMGLELNLRSFIEDDNIPEKNIVLGFAPHIPEICKVSRKADTIFIAIDFYLVMRCVAIMPCEDKDYSRDFSEIFSDDSKAVALHFYRASKLFGETQMQRAVHVTGAVINFFIQHELFHVTAGHFDIVRNHIRQNSLVRAMEFCADQHGFFSTWMHFIFPYTNGKRDLDEVINISRLFGFTYGTLMLFRMKPNKMYPSAYERLLLIMRNSLVHCQKGKSWGEDLIGLAKKGVMAGVRSAFRQAQEGKIISLPVELAFLGDRSFAPQHIHCISCSPWARAIYKNSSQSVDEVLTHKEIFEKYTHRSFNGFNASAFEISLQIGPLLRHCNMYPLGRAANFFARLLHKSPPNI